MGILNWILHRNPVQIQPHDRERINDALERIVAMNPRLQMARSFEERLAPAVAVSQKYANELVASVPPPHEANANAWSSDPYNRAFFATPDDLVGAFSRSEELRAFFDENPDLKEAYAVLGMAMTERHVLGVALEGDTMRNDVAQTTICFGDHRVRICGRTESDLRQEIVRRLVDHLAMEGLARLAADRRELQQEGRQLLQERLALLQRQGTGVRSVVGGGPVVESEELARVHAQMQENARKLADLRVPTEAIELELERVCEVLSDPSAHIYLRKKRLRIDLMNVVQDHGSQAAHEIEFNLARIPLNPPQMRAFALVRFPRAELLPAGLNIDAAMRAL
ncbi:hypothetical protein SAMN05446935_7482 [Burkholderia sp. YR290]|jgi:hypothetical protein|nr:hypothetical protein SAMN05446935_7482 [Burkholderia sp. YR290]